MKYSLAVLKTYGSCITDKQQIGEKMKGLAHKINLPKMNNFLFSALYDFGEDKVSLNVLISFIYLKIFY